MKKVAIIGAGRFAKEVYDQILDNEYNKEITFFVEDEFYSLQPDSFPLSEFDPEKYRCIIAIANPKVRKRIAEQMPTETEYFTFLHKSVQIIGKEVKIGKGAIICANVVITSNVEIGDHCQLNLGTTIGHDAVIGDYFTTAPKVSISGCNTIGECVYFGTNSSTKEGIKIPSRTTFGLNSGVIHNLTEPGTYVGTPAVHISY